MFKDPKVNFNKVVNVTIDNKPFTFSGFTSVDTDKKPAFFASPPEIPDSEKTKETSPKSSRCSIS